MFNLLVKYSPWAEGRDTIPASRAFEYTNDALVERFKPGGEIDDAVLRLPTVFMQESTGENDLQVVRVGSILRMRSHGRDLVLEYVYDPAVPPFTNADLDALAADLAIDDWEFTRTHWAIKEADLFRGLIRQLAPRRTKPRVFTVSEPERIEPTLVSVMMPFDVSFDPVYAALREAAEEVSLRCRRADDIWENPAVIQDVVSLIDRSKVVICDCSGRNPNVFYEIGIAHTLGREVILITQSESDIPFDLRHLRFLPYLNNGEGREELKQQVQLRLRDLATG